MLMKLRSENFVFNSSFKWEKNLYLIILKNTKGIFQNYLDFSSCKKCFEKREFKLSEIFFMSSFSVV